MLVICKYSYLPGCTNACEHSKEHEPEEYGGDGLMCNEETESCDEVGEDDVICIPLSEFEFEFKIKNIKRDAKNTAKSVLKGMENI